MPKGRILIIEDEQAQCNILADILRKEGYSVDTATGGSSGLELASKTLFDVILTDLRMPDMDGTAVLDNLKKMGSRASVIIMTAYGTVRTAVECMKQGASDYLTKPLDKEELTVVVSKAMEQKKLVDEVTSLRKQADYSSRFRTLVGSSPKMLEIYRTIEKVASGDATVMICGESGTGKEMVARAIHDSGDRRERSFVAVDCASFPETLMESELFGYEKGAFTGAFAKKVGLFEEANGGSLFLDEIGNLGTNLQMKLLRVLQEKEIKPLGQTKPVRVDVRIIAASNKNLDLLIKSGAFREDLYYRLNVVPVQMPPLRERKEDIPLLAGHFLEKHGKDKSNKTISPEAMGIMLEYDWPGNVRELESLIQRLVLLSEKDVITPADIPAKMKSAAIQELSAQFEMPDKGVSLAGVEKDLILKALDKSGWVSKEAARLLNISYKTLLYRMQKFNIRK